MNIVSIKTHPEYKDKIIAYLEMLLQNTNNDNNNNVTDDGNECEDGENENENINVSNNYKCSNNNDIVNNCNQSKYVINENICKSKNLIPITYKKKSEIDKIFQYKKQLFRAVFCVIL